MERGIAAQLYTLRNYLKTPADIAVTLKRVKAIGYDAVQLSGLGVIDPKELAGILQGEGLTVAATHVGYDRLLNDLDGIIEEHHLWGCKDTALGSLPKPFHTREGFIEFGKTGSEIGRKLRDAGIGFSYHNHSFEFEKFDGVTGMELIFDNADPRYLQSEIDTYWVQHGGGDPAAWISKMKGRITIVHFKDMGIVENAQVMAEVGEGNLNWSRIIDACRDASVAWYIVEQDVCRRDPFDSLAISLRNMQAMGLG